MNNAVRVPKMAYKKELTDAQIIKTIDDIRCNDDNAITCDL